MSRGLPGFDRMRVADVVDHRGRLNYDYDGLGDFMPSDVIRPDERGLFRANADELRRRAPRTVVLRVHGVRRDADSFNVDVFINQPDADHTTALEGNEHFAGSFGIFGMGGMTHHGGHHDAHGTGGGHPAEMPPTELVVDITRAVESVGGEAGALDIKLVATDAEGAPVAIQDVPLEGVSIEGLSG